MIIFFKTYVGFRWRDTELNETNFSFFHSGWSPTSTSLIQNQTFNQFSVIYCSAKFMNHPDILRKKRKILIFYMLNL